MVDLLKENQREIQKANTQHKLWLVSGSILTVAFLTIALNWNYFKELISLWAALGIGGTLTIIWWWWIMILSKKIIHHRSVEATVLSEIIEEISELREEIRKFIHKS